LFDLDHHWRLAVRRRRLLIGSGIGAMLVVFILTEFVIHHKYTAQAMIRPVAQDQNGLTGLLQSTGILQGNSPTLTQNGPPDPNELAAILQSYAFTTSMIAEEGLAPKLLKGSFSLSSLIPFLPNGPPSPYSLYLLMSARFNCDFNLMTGNMTLTFIDKSPEVARSILVSYIRRLRNQIRAQVVRDTTAALRSLEEEVAKTPDPLLRDQIYLLIAVQMQQVGTAEANANFAFTVLEPPYVPPYSSAPWVIIDSLAAAVLIPCMVFFWLVVRELLPQFKRHLAEMDAQAQGPVRDIPAAARRRPRDVPTPEHDRPGPV
jgi:hypothetical protein